MIIANDWISLQGLLHQDKSSVVDVVWIISNLLIMGAQTVKQQGNILLVHFVRL